MPYLVLELTQGLIAAEPNARSAHAIRLNLQLAMVRQDFDHPLPQQGMASLSLSHRTALVYSTDRAKLV